MGISQVWKLMLKALKAAWENLTTLIFLNLVWFFLWLSPMFLSSRFTEKASWFYISLLLSLLLLGPISAAVHHLLYNMLNGGEISVREFKYGFMKYFWPSIALTLLGLFAFAIIVISFSLTIGNFILPTFVSAVFYGVWISMALFWFLIVQYLFPLLVSQNIGILLLIKRAIFMTLDNLLISLLLVIVSGVITYISVFLVIPFIILWFTMNGLMQHYLMAELFKNYASYHSKD